MKSKAEILADISRFRGLRVLVVGDLFLDEYIETQMVDISREGPFPVLRFDSVMRMAGAAGNLASSIRGLGASVSLAAVVGRDERGRLLLDQLRSKGIRTAAVVIDPRRPTLTYTKIRSRIENSPSQELFRIDVLPSGPLDGEIERRMLSRIEAEIRRADGVVMLDQVHHLVAGRILREVPRLARKLKIPAQGSSREHIGSFRGFELITPNDREALQAAGCVRDDNGARGWRAVGERLKKTGRHRQVMLTLGAEGMALFPARGAMVRIPTFARQVVDVTGAGDAVSSVAVLGNILGWDLHTIGWTASQAAALVIARVGTHHLGADELRDAIRNGD